MIESIENAIDPLQKPPSSPEHSPRVLKRKEEPQSEKPEKCIEQEKQGSCWKAFKRQTFQRTSAPSDLGLSVTSAQAKNDEGKKKEEDEKEEEEEEEEERIEWIDKAAEMGHLECIKKIVSFQGQESRKEKRVKTDEKKESPFSFEWQALTKKPNEKTCSAAARGRALNVLSYLHEELECPWDETTLLSAIESEDLPCFSYAVLYNCPMTKTVAKAVAFSGNINMLELMWNKEFQFDGEICDAAALCKNQRKALECVLFLHHNHCPWGDLTMVNAALNGNYELIRFLREKDCPWDERATQVTSKYGNYKALNFLRDNGCPYNAIHCLRNLIMYVMDLEEERMRMKEKAALLEKNKE